MEKVLSPKTRKIHFVGIGGIGMSGLAGLLLDRGYAVSGSDLKRSQGISRLRRKGAQINIGHSRGLVRGADLVCFSSAVAGDNPEIKRAKALRIPTIRRGMLLGRLLKGKEVLAVAGSHGKTTTTSLASYVLRRAGKDAATLVGGIPHYLKAPSWWGKDLFVVETDESDGSFLQVKPTYSIITNIDKEHLGFYGSFTRLKQSFFQFAANTRKLVIGCGDEAEVRAVLKKCGRTYMTVGLGAECMLRAKEIDFGPERTRFAVYYKRSRLARIETPLLGAHNITNALSVFAFCLDQGYDLRRVESGFKDFSGTKRRLDLKGRVNGVTFFDDYAHHPREIAACLAALRPLKKKRQVVLFQPHRFSRVRDLLGDFARCFSDSDVLIITDIYPASEPAIPGIDAQLLIEKIRVHFKKAVIYIPKDKLIQAVPLLLKRGDCLVAMGAGDSNKILEKIIRRWKRA
ncbi:UDP-N-acetylmuramate--L-alanine ligase [Candidatus Omnitrophota bacterium]